MGLQIQQKLSSLGPLLACDAPSRTGSQTNPPAPRYRCPGSATTRSSRSTTSSGTSSRLVRGALRRPNPSPPRGSVGAQHRQHRVDAPHRRPTVLNPPPFNPSPHQIRSAVDRIGDRTHWVRVAGAGRSASIKVNPKGSGHQGPQARQRPHQSRRGLRFGGRRCCAAVRGDRRRPARSTVLCAAARCFAANAPVHQAGPAG